ncbi:S-layer homology domain-containing protein [Aminipila sp.]|uniref:S-layer homology domain-containing protein n=1 Tax=Aminipila sp. TaxID=2060095 RepID=UPI002899E34D|nr:S-layer homology domain-containing protein [Aminipila sp.]
MRKNKLTKRLMACVVCGTVALNFSPVFATNSYWSAQPISDFLSNKIDSPTVLKDEKYTTYITREEFSQLIVGLYAMSNNLDKASIPIEENPFTDTTNIDVQRAYSLGIIQGIDKNKFEPQNNITREQIATIIARFLNIKGINTNSTNNLISFNDKNHISNWAFKSLAYCVENQIIQGSENQLRPKEPTTVEQVITMLDRIAIKNNWITKSKDIYIYGFFLPNDTKFKYRSGSLNTFYLYIDWNSINDTQKIQADLYYMLNRKFKNDAEIVNSIINYTMKTKEFINWQHGCFDIENHSINVTGENGSTEIYFQDNTDLGDIPSIPIPKS